jgi:hypothetical protein
VALAESQPDYSHTALSWNPNLQVFVGTVIPGGRPFQAVMQNLTGTLPLGPIQIFLISPNWQEEDSGILSTGLVQC